MPPPTGVVIGPLIAIEYSRTVSSASFGHLDQRRGAHTGKLPSPHGDRTAHRGSPARRLRPALHAVSRDERPCEGGARRRRLAAGEAALRRLADRPQTT